MESEEIKKEPINGNQLKDFTIQQQPAPAYKQEEFEAFKTEVAEKLSMQQDILMKIASELGLNKNNNAKQKG